MLDRADGSSSATSACTWSGTRRQRRPEPASFFVHSQAPAGADRLPRLRRATASGSRAGSSGCRLAAEVVHRGLPRGRRRALRQEARRGQAPRVLDGPRRAEGRPRRRASPASGWSRPLADTRRRSRKRTGDRRYPFWRLTLCVRLAVEPARMGPGRGPDTPSARGPATSSGRLSPRSTRSRPPTLVYDFSRPGPRELLGRNRRDGPQHLRPEMRPHDGRAIPTFMRQALQDRPITVFGDGSQTRSFCYVDDLIRGMIALAESGQAGPINIGNPNEFTLLRARRDDHRGHGLELGDRLRGAADRRPAGAPARHHPRPDAARLGARDRAARGAAADDRALRHGCPRGHGRPLRQPAHRAPSGGRKPERPAGADGRNICDGPTLGTQRHAVDAAAATGRHGEAAGSPSGA